MSDSINQSKNEEVKHINQDAKYAKASRSTGSSKDIKTSKSSKATRSTRSVRSARSARSSKSKNSLKNIDLKTFLNNETASSSTKSDDKILSDLIGGLCKIYGSRKIETLIDPLTEQDKLEPILDSKNHKFTAFPIKYQNIYQLYREMVANFWVPEKIDFSKDYDDFKNLTKDEQHFVEMVLAFFAASDGIVNFNLGERFTREIQITEILFMYDFQKMMENIHNITYSLMLDNLVKDPTRKEFLFNAIKTVKSVKSMADWAFKWIDSSESFAHRVVAFAIVENVFFSGAFAAIFWLKNYKNSGDTAGSGKPFMNGFITSNKYIARDEGLHVRGACAIYDTLLKKLPAKTVYAIMREAVLIAQEFMNDAIPVRFIGMNIDMMKDYIEYVADRTISMLGYKRIFMKKNPFKFMESIGLDDKSNFFEVRPHEYQDPNALNKNKGSRSFKRKTDF